MEIIFGRENADMVRQKYTVLELETIAVDGKGELEVFCLIPAEKINLMEMSQLDQWITLHHDMLGGYHRGEHEYCRQAIEHLMGKFSGEVDSFYDEILNRITHATVE